MRVLLGLSALASIAAVQGQILAISYTGNAPTSAATLTQGNSCLAAITVYSNPSGATGTVVSNISNAGLVNTGQFLTATGAWQFVVGSSVTSVLFNVKTNSFTSQIQYRYSGYTGLGGSLTWICDPCVTGSFNQNVGSLSTCNTNYGPAYNFQGSALPVVSGQYQGYQCANFNRLYTLSNLIGTALTFANSFGIQLFDNNVSPGPDTTSYSFSFNHPSNIIVGDPQIVGMQGQDFQVHGMPDEIFNILTYPSIQVNARFTYLESAECHDNYTACFAHPGTYISEEGFRLGKDKIRITAGSYKKGLTVSVNGKKTKTNVDLKSGAVELVNHRRVVIHTDIMRFSVTNSDKFLNQEIELKDDKLVALGAERRQLKDNERFHPEVPLHGLQGQTWRNVEYASGLDYEGSIMDYHVVDGNLFGTDFVFNQFQA